jgi:hypothetical protein
VNFGIHPAFDAINLYLGPKPDMDITLFPPGIIIQNVRRFYTAQWRLSGLLTNFEIFGCSTCDKSVDGADCHYLA